MLSCRLPTTQVYAHCEAARSHGRAAAAGLTRPRAVVLLFINVSPVTSYQLQVSAPLHGEREQASRQEWHFTAADVYSRTVLLNGRPLLLPPSGGLPELTPKIPGMNVQ